MVALTREQIVLTALGLAEQRSWESVRLYQIASELGVTLEDLRTQFREKEDIVDAWFDSADRAMLVDAGRSDFLKLSARGRLHRTMMTWFSALSAHRRPTREMILGKFEFGHVHYQISGALRVSRTVQWIREAAQRDARLPRRAFEEAALTGIYLAAFLRWMYDDSPESSRTAHFLDCLLIQAEKISRGFASEEQAAGPKPSNSFK